MFGSYAEYIARCANPPTVQAPSDQYPQNPSRPDTSQRYFLEEIWEDRAASTEGKES